VGAKCAGQKSWKACFGNSGLVKVLFFILLSEIGLDEG
jgi:hypothetical protein